MHTRMHARTHTKIHARAHAHMLMLIAFLLVPWCVGPGAGGRAADGWPGHPAASTAPWPAADADGDAAQQQGTVAAAAAAAAASAAAYRAGGL